MWLGNVTIDIIPDDVLLLIFRLDGLEDTSHLLSWHCLIHVCKRWRTIVFGSPNFLRLRLVCGLTTTWMENLGIWPPLPIAIKNIIPSSQPDKYDFNDLVDTSIAHRSRVCEIDLCHLTSSQLLQLFSAMQEKFPALTHLLLGSNDDDEFPAPALPDGILGEYANRLQSLALYDIPIPALPKLFLPVTDLVELKISHFGLISPEEIVTSLAMLAKLRSLTIVFESPQSHLDFESRRLPPLTRSILPALGYLVIKGICEDLEDFSARIDAPLLYAIRITFLDQLINAQPINAQQLSQFIGRTPNFKTFEEAHITCCYTNVTVELDPSFSRFIELEISSAYFSYMEPSILMSSLPPLPTVERLYFHAVGLTPNLKEIWCIKNTQWLDLSHSFTALKELHFSRKFASTIMPMLQAALVGERVTDVLPALRHIFLPKFELSEPIQEAIQQFVTVRQLSGHPLTVHMSTSDSAMNPMRASVPIPLN